MSLTPKLGKRGRFAEVSPLADQNEVSMPTQPEIHTQLYENLLGLLKDSGNDLVALQNALETLEAEHGKSVYSHLIYVLSHLFFEEGVAEKHWKNIIDHKGTMEDKLGSKVDYRVALLSYFIDVKQEIENPKIIEIRLFQQTQIEAFVDQLTGLYNYRYFMNRLSEEIKATKRYDSSLSLVMFDIDDFKLYNDCYGHLKGNEVLFQLSKILLSCVREVDTLARYGGEEFAVLLPHTQKDRAYLVAERIREQVEKEDIMIKSDTPSQKSLTVSGGIATYGMDASSAQGLIEKSDKALYMAKARGKNNVAFYSKEKRVHPRFNTALKGRYALLSAEAKSFQTTDVSLGGLSFATTEDVPVLSAVEITLEIPFENDPQRKVTFNGKVIRTKETGSCNEVGVKIIDIDQRNKIDLTNYMKLLEHSAK